MIHKAVFNLESFSKLRLLFNIFLIFVSYYILYSLHRHTLYNILTNSKLK